jgi:hypothetical protein
MHHLSCVIVLVPNNQLVEFTCYIICGTRVGVPDGVHCIGSCCCCCIVLLLRNVVFVIVVPLPPVLEVDLALWPLGAVVVASTATMPHTMIVASFSWGRTIAV